MTFNAILKECYYIGTLCEEDRKTYYLIERYKSKVPKHLLQKQDRLYKEGQENFEECLKRLVYSENPLLKPIPKDKRWNDHSLLIPFKE